MKKILTVLLSILIVAALFAACTGPDTKKPAPTDAPSQATEAPVGEPTEEPTEVVTEEPTKEPDPTPVPFTDPYAVTILDWEDGDVRSLSFDTLFFDNTTVTDGDVAGWKSENDDTVDGTAGNIGSVGMRGWAGFNEEEMVDIGYQIDDRAPVFTGGFTTTEAAVKGAGGEFAQRFRVDVPVKGLTGKGHELKVIVKTELGDIYYINPDALGYVIYYDGPDAVEKAVDGEIKEGEYAATYVIDSATAKTWTGSELGDRVITYHISKAEDAVYVAIEGKGAVAGDQLQLSFNPGARMDETEALFITFEMGETVKVIQNNHKTALKDELDGKAADITALIEAKPVAIEGGFGVEAKIPADFFKVTDVENAADFNLARENLYFGMFVVLNTSEGFTNQSEIPGSDWTAKGLSLHEYVAY